MAMPIISHFPLWKQQRPISLNILYAASKNTLDKDTGQMLGGGGWSHKKAHYKHFRKQIQADKYIGMSFVEFPQMHMMRK